MIVWILKTIGPAIKDFLTTGRNVFRLKNSFVKKNPYEERGKRTSTKGSGESMKSDKTLSGWLTEVCKATQAPKDKPNKWHGGKFKAF
jgi:hypothetical protein